MGAIKLEKVEKWFDDLQVIKGLDLEVDEGEFVVFVGPSGCGKSTLLRMISGLEETSRGKIYLDGVDVTAEPPSGRELSMVFQSYALYPHMSVRDNMAFGLKVANAAKAEIADKVAKAAEILKLDEYLDRLPKALSGGQRQRVAIGRAIVREPKGFLFDEPLSNLDASLRVQMRFEIAKLHEQLGATMIYVTHDQVEAMTLADKIVVLKDGEIMQVGTPRDLYENPDNLFVAQFIGSPKMNVLPCEADDDAYAVKGFSKQKHRGVANLATSVNMGVRPEHIELVSKGRGSCDGTVTFTEYLGSDTFVYVTCGDLDTITVRCTDKEPPAKGAAVGLRFNKDTLHFFDVNELVVF